MNRKKYAYEDYNKAVAVKDATKYFIVYEGREKELNYFEAFNETFLDEKKAYVHHVLEKDTGVEGNTPLKLKERAEAFINNPPKYLKVTPANDDKFRFVLDVDKHPIEQIKELKCYCEGLNDGSLYISNFCFEVWLWAHTNDLDEITSIKSKEMKTELGTLKSMNFPHEFMDVNLIRDAIRRCEDADVNSVDYFPSEKSSKVYLLIQELLSYSYFDLEVKE